MPTDLSPHIKQGIINVRDSGGIGLPFSKGLLATSILATGVETEVAYHIAAEVDQRLRKENVTDIDSATLIDLTTDIIKRQLGEEIARRYLAWRQVKRTGRPMFVILGGAPGVGKSTVATRLAVRLGITRVVTTDTIREILRGVIAETVLPELHVSTYQQPKLDIDKGSAISFRRQAYAVGSATMALVRRLAAERKSAVIEGVHLLPGFMTDGLADTSENPLVVEILLTLNDQALHESHLTCRLDGEPARDGNRHLKNFSEIRELQDSLKQAAFDANVSEYDVADPEDLTMRIVNEIVTRARSESAVAVAT